MKSLYFFYENDSVPWRQGTILSPTLFILYVNDFSKNIDPVLSIRYADDTSLMAWSADIYELQTKLQIGTNKAMEWLRNNRLLLVNTSY